MNIIWKSILWDGEDTGYIISEYGNVRNIKTDKLLSETNEYQISHRKRVAIYYKGQRKEYKLHRLVYEVFHGPIPEGMTVDHIDENIHNNHYLNLQLLTASDNIKSYLKNNQIHGFQKKYSDKDIKILFQVMKDGMHYTEAAKLISIRFEYAYDLLRGMRRKDLWELYKPFPKTAFRKSNLSETDEAFAIFCIIDGWLTRNILTSLKIEYEDKAIYDVYRLRRKIGIKDPRYFELSFLNDIDTLIIHGKTNDEIYKILCIDIDIRISDMMARRRRKLDIPNNNCSVGDPKEIILIENLIKNGKSNNEIMNIINKEKTMYYKNTLGRLRQKLKSKVTD